MMNFGFGNNSNMMNWQNWMSRGRSFWSSKNAMGFGYFMAYMGAQWWMMKNYYEENRRQNDAMKQQNRILYYNSAS